MPCSVNAPHQIRGFPLCAKHYMEALEHSAHLDFGQWDGKDAKLFLLEENELEKETHAQPAAAKRHVG